MNLVALKVEITADPQALGYAGKSDEAVATILNTVSRQVNRETLDAGSLVASLVMSEFVALSANQKQYLQLICQAQSLPLTATVKSELSSIFPAGSTTRANLIALLKRTGTRAEELALGGAPTASDVADAKRLP